MADDQTGLVSRLLRHWTEGDEKLLTELSPLFTTDRGALPALTCGARARITPCNDPLNDLYRADPS